MLHSTVIKKSVSVLFVTVFVLSMFSVPTVIYVTDSTNSGSEIQIEMPNTPSANGHDNGTFVDWFQEKNSATSSSL